MPDTKIIQVRGAPEIASAAEAAAEVLNGGGLVGFPTETVYGIAAAASSSSAMARLREIKSRPDRPFTVHLGAAADVDRYVRDVPGPARRLIGRGWPGPVTVLLPTGGKLADPALDEHDTRAALCSGDRIGLRCPDEPVAAAMLQAVDAPIVAPSANPAGTGSPRTPEQVLEGLAGQIDLLLDHGPTRLGVDSTIVGFDGPKWTVVREGAVTRSDLLRLIGMRILFICTGNTCRSPMAEGLAQSILAERIGCRVAELADQGLELMSAGVFAASGTTATDEARQAVLRHGVDISGHRSRLLTPELINSADLILCMTRSHVDDVRRQAPAAAGKTLRVDPGGDISDPIGAGARIYGKTADRLRRALEKALQEKVL